MIDRRIVLKFIGRNLVRLLTRFELTGLENLPENGPYILAGNHVASMESLLMVCFAPTNIDILGSGDIPLDPKLAPFANLYGYIPINRGEIDQKALNRALGVLKNKGVLGIFPEGGIWERALREPKIGISWLALKADSAVIPIGFIGMKDALKHALSFRFPQIKMVIGKPLTPEMLFPSEFPLKARLIRGAQIIMQEISCLLPKEETSQGIGLSQNCKLSYELKNLEDGTISNFSFPHEDHFSKLIQHPVIMDVFYRNLKLPIQPMMIRNQFIKSNDILTACIAIHKTLEEKPGFLPYRFGLDEGLFMKASVVELIDFIKKLGTIKSLIRISEL